MNVMLNCIIPLFKAETTSTAANEDETLSATQALGMTIQCLADLAEEGYEDSQLSPLMDSNRTVASGFIPQDSDERVMILFICSLFIHLLIF